MHVEFDVPSADSAGRIFLTWTPVPASARLRDGPQGGGQVTVTLRNAGTGGQLVFASKFSDPGKSTLKLALPGNGTPTAFFMAGQFGQPSAGIDDAVVEAVGPGSSGVLGSRSAMVRVRKNTENLTTAERDRFLTTFGTLNGSGAGRFRDFREMHDSNGTREAHGNVGFLPWHRAYLLDLERELQAIDPSVALPYWRFDKAAPKLFSRRFIGMPNSAGRVEFSAGHPLISWKTDSLAGINRNMGFPSSSAPSGLITEAQTLALGNPPAGATPPVVTFSRFHRMEFNPHNRAHTRFSGFISNASTAPRDPLFFLLHANVDRLWAKWQWLNGRMDPGDIHAFAPAAPNRIGHRLGDTMWPWNGVTAMPRPSTAPGGGMASSPVTSAPGTSPKVRDMLDYQGRAGGSALGFAYDDVPFEP